MTSTDTTAADATADTTADTAADTATADDPGTIEQRMAAAVEAAVTELVPLVGTRAACVAVGRSRATHYRHHRVGPVPAPRPRVEPRPQPRALSEVERAEVLGVLHCERFVDAAPATVYATLLDEGRYLCSESTMYRILRERGEVRERRRQATHPPRVRPELVATAPNRCWSWDITKLRGPAKWTYYHLYVIIDIYSRYVPGWLIAERESAALAERLLAETITKHQIARDRLTLHADRGTSMASKPVAMLLADLGVTKSHSRPRCSNDNPFSEAGFKTLKYRPDFPERFGSIQDARAFCHTFFRWYNHDHRHSGVGLHSPADVHFGRAAAVRAARAQVLTATYRAHPERFVRKHPEPPTLPEAVWINKPDPTNSTNP
jgi:putative transposase